MPQQQPNVVVVGYTLDACYIARTLANNPSCKSVTFINTGILGYPLDTMKDFLTEASVLKLQDAGVKCDFTKYHNARFMYIPHKNLAIQNNTNGLFQYPLNKASFSNDAEYANLINGIGDMEVFMDEYKETTKPHVLYSSKIGKYIIRGIFDRIPNNKFNGIKISKMTSRSYKKEFPMDFIGDVGTGNIYYPSTSYNDICMELLNHPKIRIRTGDISKIKDTVSLRIKNTTVYMCDNRVDIVCNYMYGMFDRIRHYVSNTKNVYDSMEPNCVRDGVILTPMDQSWGASCHGDERVNIYTVGCNPGDAMLSDLVPVFRNQQMLAKYKNLFTLYADKVLMIGSKIETILH